MTRNLLLTALAVVLSTGPAAVAAAPAFRTPHAKFAAAQVVVTGKVTSIEKDTVDATLPYAGAKDKVAYKVAVVKIDAKFAGADNLTHIKIGFIPAAKVDPNPNLPRLPFRPSVELKEGTQVLVYLSKHPAADFYVMPFTSPPADLGAPGGAAELEQIKAFAAATADPMKGLKSDKAAVRVETAALLVAKYRAYPELAAATEQVAIPADESKLILKALAGGEWESPTGRAPAALQAFYQLGLTEKDGWKQPQPKPGENFAVATKQAFVAWLDGPGKDYQIKKIVAKKAEK